MAVRIYALCCFRYDNLGGWNANRASQSSEKAGHYSSHVSLLHVATLAAICLQDSGTKNTEGSMKGGKSKTLHDEVSKLLATFQQA